MSIYFYSTQGIYGCFSNFSGHGFELEGKFWKTSEHYFQAQKFPGTEYEGMVKDADSPMKAANMGRKRTWPLRPDWEEVKDELMRKAVLRKFETHKDIRDILLSTGEEELVEATKDDYYWGCGEKGTGKNMLGKILMEVREKLSHRS